MCDELSRSARAGMYDHDAKCVYCGDDKVATLDHIVPATVLKNMPEEMGVDPFDPMFMVRACRNCNSLKSDRYPQNAPTGLLRYIPLRFFYNPSWVLALVGEGWVDPAIVPSVMETVVFMESMNHSSWAQAGVGDLEGIIQRSQHPSVSRFLGWAAGHADLVGLHTLMANYVVAEEPSIAEGLSGTDGAGVLRQLLHPVLPDPEADDSTNIQRIQRAFAMTPIFSHVVRENYGAAWQVLVRLRERSGEWSARVKSWLAENHPLWNAPLTARGVDLIERELDLQREAQMFLDVTYRFSSPFRSWWREQDRDVMVELKPILKKYFPQSDNLNKLWRNG